MKSDTDMTQFDSLKAIYMDVIAKNISDPIEKILVMTYEFDDQQLLNLICARPLEDDFELRRNQRKFIADLKPVIFYDARKTREFNRLPHFLDLVPVRTKPFSCHHSKAYLIVTGQSVRLVLGSLNLTYSGLFKNREVFTDFCWNKDETEDLQVLRDFVELLKRQRADIPQAVASEALIELLNVIDGRLAQWGVNHVKVRHTLVASGTGTSGLSQLAERWSLISTSAPKRLFVVSPFFDQGDGVLIDLLGSAVGAADAVHIVTDERSVSAICKKHFGAATRDRILNVIPVQISQQERIRIEKFNDGRSTEGLHLERKLHAKILVLESEMECLVYIGSANFTSKAWNGDNFELGVISVETCSADTLIRRICAGLGAGSENVYSRVPDTLTLSDIVDDEDYVEETGYPNFIERIVLHYDEISETVHFRIDGGTPDEIGAYDVSWGSLPLSISERRSQDILSKEFYVRLVGGRNLSFVPKAQPALRFCIPFWHAPELVQKKDEFVFPNADDWLQYYLGIDIDDGGQPGEHIPGEPVSPKPQAMFEVDRESNVIIQMQRYLSLFSAIEGVFTKKADEADKLLFGDERSMFVRKHLTEPINAYAKILKREFQQSRNKKTAQLEFCFKLGELLLFFRSLAEKLPELQASQAALASLLTDSVPEMDAGLKSYINYCNQNN
ncbi:phospholipase D-like domain-containing protein [Herbaspirillum rhizosphaerae]|uniref:Phospholipase D-like domain-containing protein n=1 Tax=Herbaspirillum rhizosphaerae TaxID=346179 RepID=A0ABW8Z1J3_9BURK